MTPMRLTALVLITLIAAVNATIGGETNHTVHDVLISDGRKAGEVTVKFFLSPTQARSQQWMTALGLASVVVASSAADAGVRRTMKALDNPWAGRVEDIGHLYPNSIIIHGGATALYLNGLLRDKPTSRRIGLEIWEAFVFANTGTAIMKQAFGRARPFLGKGSHYFRGPTLDPYDYKSFPSGDVTNAFAFSSVLAAEAHSTPVTIAVYALAATTAFQRLHRDQHWFSDIVGAAIWASEVGWGVVKLNRTQQWDHIQAGIGERGLTLTLK
jgi:membrane-associated phospholipid phosphatase